MPSCAERNAPQYIREMVGERVRPVARNVFCGSPPPLLRKFASHSRLQPRAPSRPANQGELDLTLSRDAAPSARSSRQKKEWWLLAWNACSEPPLHYAADAVLPWATTIGRPPSPRPLVGPLVAPSAPEPLNRCRIGRNSGWKIDRGNGPTDGRIATETTNGRQRPGIASARQLTTVEQEPSRCLHSRGDTYGRIKATALPIAPDRGAPGRAVLRVARLPAQVGSGSLRVTLDLPASRPPSRLRTHR